MDQKHIDAHAIIESLRRGATPRGFVRKFSVGREDWLKPIDTQLSGFLKHGGQVVRFICGAFGDGKTHFMSLIEDKAFDEGYAVSYLSCEFAPLNKYEIIYRKIMSNLSVKGSRDGLQELLNRWIKINNQKGREETPDPDFNEERVHNYVLSKTTDLVEGMELNYANAISAYIKNYLIGDTEATNIILQWLYGEEVGKRPVKKFGIFTKIDKSNSGEMLGSTVKLLLGLGYSGLIILMDELDRIPIQRRDVRDVSYENLRQMLDNTRNMKNVGFFGAITPILIVDGEKGFKSHDALWARVKPQINSNKPNYFGPIINLDKTPLSEEDLIALGRKVKEYHALAMDWEPEEKMIDGLIEGITKRLVHRPIGSVAAPPRVFVRTLCSLMDTLFSEVRREDIDIDTFLAETIDEIESEIDYNPNW